MCYIYIYINPRYRENLRKLIRKYINFCKAVDDRQLEAKKIGNY